MNTEKQYTILFGKNNNSDKIEVGSFYLYLTRFFVEWEEFQNWGRERFRQKYLSEGTKQNEATSYEGFRQHTTEDDLYYFTLEEAERILKKLRKKAFKINKTRREAFRDYKYGKARANELYAYGKEPFIVKKTKIKQYLKKG